MDDELLNALYGVSDEQYDDDDMIKEAQAELVEAVAEEAGLDLDEMDDEELDKFAEYVLTGGEGGDMSDPALAEADRMGRAMAHAYADEQIKIAHMIDEGTYPGLEDDEDPYEAALYAQASRWEMLKQASAGPTGDFDKLRYSDRMRIAKGDFGRDAATKKKYTLSDTEYNKRQRAMAMLGRGTGFYDIQSGREVLRNLKNVSGSVTEAQRKMMKRDQAYRDAMKKLTPAELKEYRSRIIKDGFKTSLSTSMGTPLGRAVPGSAPADLLRARLIKEDIARKAGRGLILRGAGKATASAGLLGGAAYGIKRAFDR